MLIITRQVNETILIGEDIRIKVVQIRGKQVRLGIEAPPGFLILRGEAFGRDEIPEKKA